MSSKSFEKFDNTKACCNCKQAFPSLEMISYTESGEDRMFNVIFSLKSFPYLDL